MQINLSFLEAEDDSWRFNFYPLTCYSYMCIFLCACVDSECVVVQKILPLPLFILAYGTNNSMSFISEHCRSNSGLCSEAAAGLKWDEETVVPGVPCDSQGSALRTALETCSRNQHMSATGRVCWSQCFGKSNLPVFVSLVVQPFFFIFLY